MSAEPTPQQGRVESVRARMKRLGLAVDDAHGRPLVYSAEELRRMMRRPAQRAAPTPTPATPPPAPLLYRRDLPRERPARRTRTAPAGPPVALEEAVPGREVVREPDGRFYQVPTPVADLEGAGELDRLFLERWAAPGSPLRARVEALAPDPPVEPADLLFMDLETAGLSSCPLFLVGTMAWEGSGFVVRQALARHYAEEAAVVAEFLEALAPRRVIVSFNGKSFDVPFLRARAAAHRLPWPGAPAHLDLLHHSRRAWKKELPDCKLQTLERHLCGRGRTGDIPGAEIPEAYHAFVRTGDAREMVDILKHNLLDLVTLAELMVQLP